ncbi:trehalose-phosphatase [Sphingomonas morindae]|uniref:Trehalose 6-phosphate phosphatase n=1 Tax=Sphingomonas morindae TaxID=1541170 RepID=A0ABY4XAZ3_9SPHN|nr:trehalose-phosphatase [Sphingomonas morindae]USI74028.1 trehalose-phosphatase [Sphingomonas morindae]
MADASPLPAPPATLLDGAALFLDFDGTLVALSARPESIRVSPETRALLPALARALDGRVAVVSGRPALDILAHLGIDPASPGFAVAGSHGLETIWPDGRHDRPARSPALDRALARFEAEAAAMPGVVVEAKPLGVSLHYRQAPAYQAACEALGAEMAAGTDLEIQHGKMVCELKMHGADKGDAVRRLAAVAPLAGARPVFVGDDLTDEAGFRAATALGGAGVLVGARAPTAAAYALADVDAVHRWLGTLAGTD